MLSGLLPFDDDSNNEEIITKMIVFNECKFPKNACEGRRDEVIN